MDSQRVLLISGEYPPMPGGMGDYTALLRHALAGQGVSSVVLTSRGAVGADVHTVRSWRSGAFRRVAAIVASEQVDVIHIQYQAGAYDMRVGVNMLPYLIRSRIGLPVVTTFHDLRPPYVFPKAGPIRDLIMLRMARRSSAVVVTNPGDYQTLRRRRIDPHLIHIGPNLPPPRPLDGPVDTDTVAFFGYPTRTKGILETIQAIGMIERPRRPRLVLVGDQGVAAGENDIVPAEEIDARAAAAGVEVERTGRLPAQEASDRLARAGVIALPFPAGVNLRSGSLLAALQSGRPVVTTEPQSAWRIEPLATMQQLVLVIRNYPEDLRDAIVESLENPPPPSPLPDEFQWTTIASRHRDLYASLSEKSAGNR